MTGPAAVARASAVWSSTRRSRLNHTTWGEPAVAIIGVEGINLNVYFYPILHPRSFSYRNAERVRNHFIEKKA
jgi:hypothetical protein